MQKLIPNITLYSVGLSSLETQCAAVTTHSGDTSEAPHINLPLLVSFTCHGHAPGTASFPAITRPFAANDFPQFATIKMK